MIDAKIKNNDLNEYIFNKKILDIIKMIPKPCFKAIEEYPHILVKNYYKNKNGKFPG